jgi:hypothetical protein
MIGVILLHASGRFIITPEEINQFSPLEFTRWSIVDLYQSIAVPLGVPLFQMLSGALLLQPQKKDTLPVFQEKMGQNRFTLPVLGDRIFRVGFFRQKYSLLCRRHSSRYTQRSIHATLVPLCARRPLLFDSDSAHIHGSCRPNDDKNTL